MHLINKKWKRWGFLLMSAAVIGTGLGSVSSTMNTHEPTIVHADDKATLQNEEVELDTDGNKSFDKGTTAKDSKSKDLDSKDSKDSDSKDSGDKEKETEKEDPIFPEYGGATTYNLSAKSTWKDLYASVIFSKGEQNAVSSANISLQQLAKLPLSGDTSVSERYGDIDTNANMKWSGALGEDPDQKAGKYLANYLATLNQYGWLTTQKKDTNIGSLITLKLGKGVQSMATDFLLSNAYLGAKVYDMSVSMIRAFQKFMQGFDVPYALGFNQSGNKNNWINQLVRATMDMLKITPTTLQLIKGLVWTILVANAIIMIMINLNGYRMGRATGILGRMLLRLAVVGLALTSTGEIQKIIDTMAVTLTDEYAAPENYTTKYVTDSVAFAATSNLDLSLTGQSGGFDGPVGKPDAKYKPSIKNVETLNNAVQERVMASQMRVTDDGNDTAAEFLKGLTSGEIANVNDYFLSVESAKNGSTIAASKGPAVGSTISVGTTSDANGNKKNSYYNYLPATVYFQSTRNKNINATTEKDDAKVNGKSDEANKLKKERGNSGSVKPYSQNANTNGAYYYYLSGSQALSAKRVVWNDMSSYIYGASANNSDETANKANYLNTTGTMQNNNPVTGEEADGINEKRALFTNSLGVAIYNRYMGTGGNTLSNQSTAFILQSYIDGKKVSYQGYNVANSDADKGKSTSANGAVFYRYTIPNSGDIDFMSKAAGIGVVWISTAVCAVLALIYLLRAPIFASLFKMIAGFLRAVFTGDIIALGEYLIHYMAIQFSFAFALAGVYTGSNIVNFFTGKIKQLQELIAEKLSVVGKAVSASSSASELIPGLGVIVLIGIVTYLMAWPIMSLRLGSNSNKEKKVGIIGLITLFPYILAEAATDWLRNNYALIYGKSYNRSFSRAISQQAQGVNQGDLIKEKVAKGINTAGKVAIGVGTGGAGLGAMSALGMAGKAAGAANALGNMGRTLSGGFKAAGDGALNMLTSSNEGEGLEARNRSLFDKVGHAAWDSTAGRVQDFKDKNAANYQDSKYDFYQGGNGQGIIADGSNQAIDSSRNLAEEDATYAYSGTNNVINNGGSNLNMDDPNKDVENETVANTTMDNADMKDGSIDDLKVNEVKADHVVTDEAETDKVDAETVETDNQSVEKASANNETIRQKRAEEVQEKASSDERGGSIRSLLGEVSTNTKQTDEALNKLAQTGLATGAGAAANASAKSDKVEKVEANNAEIKKPKSDAATRAEARAAAVRDKINELPQVQKANNNYAQAVNRKEHYAKEIRDLTEQLKNAEPGSKAAKNIQQRINTANRRMTNADKDAQMAKATQTKLVEGIQKSLERTANRQAVAKAAANTTAGKVVTAGLKLTGKGLANAMGLQDEFAKIKQQEQQNAQVNNQRAANIPQQPMRDFKAEAEEERRHQESLRTMRDLETSIDRGGINR